MELPVVSPDEVANEYELYKRFYEQEKLLVDSKGVKAFRLWGHHSLCIWFIDNSIYKAKYRNNKFYLQEITEEDVKRKYGPLPIK